jgi:hypothetical protein
MYLDGELPMETFKERMQLIADRHGKDNEFYGYNREDLGDHGMPPLNTEAGQAWPKREIAAVKPDLVVFDSIMCLLIGFMSNAIKETIGEGRIRVTVRNNSRRAYFVCIAPL